MNITLPLRKKKGGASKEWKKLYVQSLYDFAQDMIRIQEDIDFPMSSRGWCYALEPHGLNKGDFGWCQAQINRARLEGFLEPGFILEEEGHKVYARDDVDWSAQEWVDSEYKIWQDSEQTFKDCDKTLDSANMSFWEDQDYFIQLLVEKSDLKSLFMKVCNKYKIPIANMRGWGSMEQKAEMAKNFREAEARGQKTLLFVCGDFDPPGIGISDALEGTFKKISEFSGWDPENLIIERIGLNFKFIKENKLTWIDGLTTISGADMSDPNHKCYRDNIYGTRDYISKYGARKCEANAVVVIPELGRKMLIDKIEEYLGKDCYENYVNKILNRRKEVKKLIKKKLEDE